MVESFLNALSSLCADASRTIGTELPIECRHFFSGAAAYTDDRIFMSLTPVGLALKLPEETQKELVREGAKPLRYFPKGPVKKDYAVLPESYAKDVKKLAPLISRSIEYAQSFPKPRKRAKTQNRKPAGRGSGNKQP